MEIVNRRELLTFSDPIRNDNLARNRFNSANFYNEVHPDALSTGDEQGKGEFNGNVGGRSDILQRNSLIARNFYNKDRIYGIVIS